jgi:hypothetical protein
VEERRSSPSATPAGSSRSQPVGRCSMSPERAPRAESPRRASLTSEGSILGLQLGSKASAALFISLILLIIQYLAGGPGFEPRLTESESAPSP